MNNNRCLKKLLQDKPLLFGKNNGQLAEAFFGCPLHCSERFLLSLWYAISSQDEKQFYRLLPHLSRQTLLALLTSKRKTTILTLLGNYQFPYRMQCILEAYTLPVLPLEIIFYLARWCRPRDILSLACTSHYFNQCLPLTIASCYKVPSQSLLSTFNSFYEKHSKSGLGSGAEYYLTTNQLPVFEKLIHSCNNDEIVDFVVQHGTSFQLEFINLSPIASRCSTMTSFYSG